MKLLLVLVWSTVLAVPAAAQAELVDITWDGSGRFERIADVAPGRFAEACGKLGRGDKVAWRFEASVPMDFNVHYHAGKSVVYPVRQGRVAAASGTLRAEQAQDYCWMWTNKSAKAVKLRVELAR